MKTHIVQLERDDDVVSARDKMMWSKAPRILIVWPRRGRVLNREIDVTLIKRQSQKLGAQLALVTFDDEVIMYASELGIPSFSSVSEAQRKVWRSSRRDNDGVDRPPKKWTLQELRDWKSSTERTSVKNVPVRLAAFIIGVMAVLVLGLFLLPGATVSFQLAEEVQTVELSVLANPEVPAPTVAGVIPVSKTSVIVEGQDQIAASGILKLSDKYAEGEVELTNLTDESVLVEEGTIVLTLTEPVVRFQTLKSVTISAGEENTAIVKIQAVVPGESGNVAADTILAMEGSSGLALAVSNLTPTGGGEDRNAPMPTEQDLRRISDRLLTSLKESARLDLERMLGESKVIMPDTLQVVEVISERQEPKPGEPGDVLTLTLQVVYEAQYIERDDLEEVAAFAMDASVQDGFSAVPGTLQLTSVRQSNAGAEISEWQVVAERKVHEHWQRDTVVRSLLGAKPDQIGIILAADYQLASPPQVRLQPEWWPRLPYLPLRIQLEEK